MTAGERVYQLGDGWIFAQAPRDITAELGNRNRADALGWCAHQNIPAAQGGGILATLAAQTGVAGVAYLRPFGIQREAALGVMWSQLIPNLVPAAVHSDQYGLEAYWNIGVTPDATVTPGIQLIFNPVFNPKVDFVAVPHIKFRVTL
jgi:Carbohydrate-selective porin, OprB family